MRRGGAGGAGVDMASAAAGLHADRPALRDRAWAQPQSGLLGMILSLTHLAEAGVQLPILMAKSRHTSLISLAVYAQPTFVAAAAATAALDPDRRH